MTFYVFLQNIVIQMHVQHLLISLNIIRSVFNRLRSAAFSCHPSSLHLLYLLLFPSFFCSFYSPFDIFHPLLILPFWTLPSLSSVNASFFLLPSLRRFFIRVIFQLAVNQVNVPRWRLLHSITAQHALHRKLGVGMLGEWGVMKRVAMETKFEGES